jgi:hypothetical protein
LPGGDLVYGPDVELPNPEAATGKDSDFYKDFYKGYKWGHTEPIPDPNKEAGSDKWVEVGDGAWKYGGEIELRTTIRKLVRPANLPDCVDREN